MLIEYKTIITLCAVVGLLPVSLASSSHPPRNQGFCAGNLQRTRPSPHHELIIKLRPKVPQDIEAAARTRDTVAQTLYLRLFSHIVDTGNHPIFAPWCLVFSSSSQHILSVNTTLLSDPPPSSPRVCAVLDMFG